MTLTPSTTLREIALRILIEAAQSKEFVETFLDRGSRSLETRDRARLRFLVTTVVRRKLTLETVLKEFVRKSVEPDLWQLLMLGAAQILFGSEQHRHADVNETVELARSLGKPRWCKLINGVLRNLNRTCSGEKAAEIGPDVYPVLSLAELRRLNKSLFPDPTTNFSEYVSCAFSLPNWLVPRWESRWGQQRTLQIASWTLNSPRMCLRVNRNKIDRRTLLAQFQETGHAGQPGHLDTSIVNIDAASPTVLPGWEQAYFSVQDETAQRAAITLDPQPGETVLDLCAAPGTKTLHLAELMNGEGKIIATDLRESRLHQIRDNVNRAKAELIEVRKISARGNDIPAGPFDRILVDAPCTNTGVLGKRVDARWRLSQRDLEELSDIQVRLLMTAADRLRSGGKLLYSTCSIESEENEQVVEQFLRENPDFRCEAQQTFLPGEPSDGGFQSLLGKA